MKDFTPYGSKLSVDEWSSSRKSLKDLYPSEKKFLLKIIKKSNSFLDLGCATGNFIKIIENKTKINNYLGIDVSENMLVKARKLHPDYNFKKYDGKNIKTKKKFDLVYCFGTLQYCNNYKDLIKQFIKSSKKFVNFDLRFTFDQEVISKKKSYQIIPFSNNSKLPYNILNFFDFLKFLTLITKKKFSIKLYGYKQKPANNVVSIYNKVYMMSILIDKTKPFELNVDLNEKIKK